MPRKHLSSCPTELFALLSGVGSHRRIVRLSLPTASFRPSAAKARQVTSVVLSRNTCNGSPVVAFQIRAVPSPPPLARISPVGENATAITAFSWPTSVSVGGSHVWHKYCQANSAQIFLAGLGYLTLEHLQRLHHVVRLQRFVGRAHVGRVQQAAARVGFALVRSTSKLNRAL